MTPKEMKRNIHKHYRKYKRFFKIKGNSNIDRILFYHRSEDGHKEYVKTSNEDFYKGEANLYVSYELFDLDEEQIKIYLMHEFTHIQDGMRLRGYFDNEMDFYKVMLFYAEYHSNYLDLMQALQTNSGKTKSFYSDTKIPTATGKHTIIDLITSYEIAIYSYYLTNDIFNLFKIFTLLCGTYKFYEDYFADANRNGLEVALDSNAAYNLGMVMNLLYDFDSNVDSGNFTAVLNCPYIN